MEIGDNIRKYRELRSLTLPDLATQAGVSKAFLWEIEAGNSKRPGAETLYKIAEVLGVTIAHLNGNAPQPDGAAWIEPEINDGLRAFINERKRQGQALEPEEVESLSFVQLKGGRPETKQQWAVVYGVLCEMTGSPGGE
jgi:transcriptional regulator with XRE-family HTH domain